MALPVTDRDLEARLRSRLDEVEKALYGHVQSRFPFITEAASHLLDAGGKRFRPLLVLLAAEAGDHAGVDDVVTAPASSRSPTSGRPTTTTSWTRPSCAAARSRPTPAGTTSSRS